PPVRQAKLPAAPPRKKKAQESGARSAPQHSSRKKRLWIMVGGAAAVVVVVSGGVGAWLSQGRRPLAPSLSVANQSSPQQVASPRVPRMPASHGPEKLPHEFALPANTAAV